MTASEQVRRVQELRRSNAATAVPGRRNPGPSPDEWDDTRHVSSRKKDTSNDTSNEEFRLPSRGEVADFLYPIVRRLCREQRFRFVPKGKSKHPGLIAPTGERIALPTTLFDGPVRYKYLANLRRIGADLTFASSATETVVPAGDAPDMSAPQLDMPWTDAEWRQMQASAPEWWRQRYAPEPEPVAPAPEPEPAPRLSRYGEELLDRLEAAGLPRADAKSDTYPLGSARQMVRDGYPVETVSRRTGWGAWWLADAV